jgi:hypothetical protein
MNYDRPLRAKKPTKDKERFEAEFGKVLRTISLKKRRAKLPKQRRGLRSEEGGLTRYDRRSASGQGIATRVRKSHAGQRYEAKPASPPIGGIVSTNFDRCAHLQTI